MFLFMILSVLMLRLELVLFRMVNFGVSSFIWRILWCFFLLLEKFLLMLCLVKEGFMCRLVMVVLMFLV